MKTEYLARGEGSAARFGINLGVRVGNLPLSHCEVYRRSIFVSKSKGSKDLGAFSVGSDNQVSLVLIVTSLGVPATRASVGLVMYLFIIKT